MWIGCNAITHCLTKTIVLMLPCFMFREGLHPNQKKESERKTAIQFKMWENKYMNKYVLYICPLFPVVDLLKLYMAIKTIPVYTNS